jgi:hypothetical protein
MVKPDSCPPEIHDAYLKAQRVARSEASFKARRLDRHMRGVVQTLCPRQSGGSTPVGSVELKRQKDSCEARAADRLRLWAIEQKDRLAWFNDADLTLIKDAGGQSYKC